VKQKHKIKKQKLLQKKENSYSNCNLDMTKIQVSYETECEGSPKSDMADGVAENVPQGSAVLSRAYNILRHM